jgi:membrane-bound metal-dependent hydrolase YbcI (DUF457 family)
MGGTLAAVLLTLAMLPLRKGFSSLLSFFKLEQVASFKGILIAALSGIYIHILLDSTLYTDIQPFYPLDYNPFLTTGIFVGLDAYTFCIWNFYGAAIIYGVRLFLLWRKSR